MFQLFQRPTCPLLRDSSDLDKYSFEHLAKNEFRCPHKLRIYARRFIVATLDYLHLKELICQIVRR